MAKDPSFLFYSKDWLEGTAELLPAEKGIYIDLLAHQHQKGSLPSDTKRLARIVSLSEIEFLELWDGICEKFHNRTDNRLVNRKLESVMGERAEKSKKNKIISCLAVAVRLSKEPYEKIKEAKKGFNCDDFTKIPTERLSETVSEWLSERLKSIANANANANANNINSYSTIEEKTTNEEMLVIEMNKIWMKHNPNYNYYKEVDYPAYLQIAYYIADRKKIMRASVVGDNEKEILRSWEKIVDFITNKTKDSFFKKLTINGISISKNMQNIEREMSVSCDKEVKTLKGIKFTETFSDVIFSDGSRQILGNEQKIMAQSNQLFAKDIKKGSPAY